MKRRFAIPAFLYLLAACNFPTPTASPPTEIIDVAAVVPPDEPTDDAAPPEAAASPTYAFEPTHEVPTSAPPQNLRIVYTNSGNLWAQELGSDPTLLVDSGDVSEVRISDDGEWIAYTIRDPDEDTAALYSVRFDGNVRLVLLEASAFDAFYPLEGFTHYTLSSFEFLPGSHSVLFNTRGVFDGPGLAKNDDLATINAESGQLMGLLPRGEGGDFTSSPDGDRIAIVRPDSLSIVDADSGNRRQEIVTFTPAITYSEYLFYPLPVWSDSVVVLPVPREDPFFGEEPGAVWSVNGEATLLTQPDGDLFNPQRQLPIVSPDGMHLALFRPAEAAGEQHLIVQRLDNGDEIAYDTGPIQWQGWGPDSYKFAYSKGEELFVGDLLGAPTALGSGTAVRWINSTEFFYLDGVPWNWTLARSNVQGDYTPLWGLNGQFVVYDFAQ